MIIKNFITSLKFYIIAVYNWFGFKKIIFIIALAYCIFIHLFVENDPDITELHRLKVTSYFIETEGCTIPSFDPYHVELKAFFGSDEKIHCSRKVPLTYQYNTTLKLNKTLIKDIPNFSHCHYEGIQKVPMSDFEISFTNKILFTDDIMVKEEFVRVYCFDKKGWNIYRNFHAFVLPNPDKLNELNKRRLDHQRKNGVTEMFNIMMIGIDSVSRFNHIVKMPKTRDFILNNLSALEFKGYTKVAANTLVNIVPMTTGKFKAEEFSRLGLPEDDHVDNFTFIFKEFSKNGYVTLFGEDHPIISIFNYNTKGFQNKPVDYYLRPFTLAMDADHSVWNNKFCVLNRPETEIILDYAQDLYTCYTDVPKFSFTFNTRLTHDSVPYLTTADDYYFKMLQKTYEKGIFNNTVMFFFGDHGKRFGTFMKTDYGKIQSRLPMMYVVFPAWFSHKYPEVYKNLQINTERLTSPFDIHETLKDLLYFTGKPRREKQLHKRGISLFDSISGKRTCSDADIIPHWCVCKTNKIKGIGTSHKLAMKALKFIINYINDLISQHSKCAKLKLYAIEDIRVYNSLDHKLLNSTYDVVSGNYTRHKTHIFILNINLITTPGNGDFETTILYDNEKDSFNITSDSITRTNAYHSDGDCIKETVLRQYCYCS